MKVTVVEELLKTRKVKELADQVLEKIDFLEENVDVAFDDEEIQEKKNKLITVLKNSKKRHTLPKDPYQRMALVSLSKGGNGRDSNIINELTVSDFYSVIVKDWKEDVRQEVEFEIKTFSLTSLREFKQNKLYKLLDESRHGNYSERDYIQAICILISFKNSLPSFQNNNWREKVKFEVEKQLRITRLKDINQIFTERYLILNKIEAFKLPLTKITKIVRIEVYKAMIDNLTLLK